MRAFRMDNSCHGLITGRRVMIPLVLIFAISFVFYENTIVLNQFVGSNWQDSQTLTVFQMATNVSVDSSGRARGAATLPGSSSIGNSHNNNNNNNNNDTDHRELNRIHNKLDNITQLLEEVIQERARHHLLKDEQSQTPQVPEHDHLDSALTSQGDNKSAKDNSSSGAFSLSFEEVWQRKSEKNATTTMIRTGIIDDNSTTMDSGTIGIPESQWLLSQEDTELESWKVRFTKDKTIPKIIHKVLLTKHGNIHDLLRNEPDELKQAHESWTKMNPGYQIRYFSLNLARAYLREYFHPVFLRAFDCIQAFAGKSNLFRLAVVFREGGWYSDWKEQCNIPELLEWLATQNQGRKRFNATIVFAYDKGTLHSSELEYIMNAFFGAQPRHPVIARALERVLLNVQSEYYGPTPQANTGPGVLGSAYKDAIAKYPDLQKRAVNGKYQWNLYRFNRPAVIIHKCDGCSSTKNVTKEGRDLWSGGNDYVQLHDARNYYCQDARSILE